MLTKRQKEILDFIGIQITKRGVAPSLREIANHLGVTSLGTVQEHIEKLREKGYLGTGINKARSLHIKSDHLIQIPLLGRVAAGQPIEAITEGQEIIAVPRSRLPQSLEGIYALKVVGESMIDEHINDGDIILVRDQSIAHNGEKVVALIDNYETTLKTFFQEKDHIRLQPANKKMEPIIVRSGNTGFAIQGVVIDVIKNISQ